MSFVVRKLSDLDVSQSQRSTGAERTRGPYPKPRSVPGAVVKSTLKLLDYPPSDGAPQYSVLLEQTDKTRSNAFVLYESDCRQDVLKQFAVILKTLKPLVEDGVVMLSTYLLTLFDFKDTELTDSELQDVIERDERSDEETAPQEEDDTAAETIKRAPRVEEDSSWILSMMKKEPTELEAAFKKNHFDYYRRLMERGQSLSEPVDGSEDDSNYLHFAAEKKAHKFITSAYNYIFQIQKSDPGSHQIEDFRMALNAKNKKDFTPLMLAVRIQHVESALALLLAGADPDIPDGDDNTPLHHAVQLGNPELVRLLVVFFANLKDADRLLKKAGQAPGSDSKDASLCREILKEMKEAAGSNGSGTSDSKSIPDDRTPDDSMFLLSLDGGSIKCVITIQILLHLAKQMKEQQGNGDPVRLQSYFDYMAGTSAGSFIVLGLRYCNNITLEMCRAAAFKVSQEVMSRGPTFDSEVMEQNLKEIVGGEDLTMTCSDSEKQRVIITTVLGDKDPPVLHLLCNYPRRKAIPSPIEEETDSVKEILSGERKVWEAARASSAAPYYFEPFKGRLIDGGVVANNPTLDSLVEIVRQTGEKTKVGLVLSVGTGVSKTKQLKHVGVHRPSGVDNIVKSISKAFSSISGLVNLFNQFCSQSTQSDGQEVERADAWCRVMGAHYVRLSPELSKKYDFGESNTVTLTEMMYEGHKYALEQREKIDQVARLLLKRVPIKQPK